MGRVERRGHSRLTVALQSHFVGQGLEVVGCTRGATPKIVNAVHYVVETYNPTNVTLRLHPDFVANTDEEEDEVVVPTAQLTWEESYA